MPLAGWPNEGEYELHQAALEWSLAESIVIQSIEESQGRVNWRDRLEPCASFADALSRILLSPVPICVCLTCLGPDWRRRGYQATVRLFDFGQFVGW